jgi:hypothetical protein
MERTDKKDSSGNRPRSNSLIQESPHSIHTFSEQEKNNYYSSRATMFAARDIENQEGLFCKICNMFFSYEPPKEIDHSKWSTNRVENRLKTKFTGEHSRW